MKREREVEEEREGGREGGYARVEVERERKRVREGGGSEGEHGQSLFTETSPLVKPAHSFPISFTWPNKLLRLKLKVFSDAWTSWPRNLLGEMTRGRV